MSAVDSPRFEVGYAKSAVQIVALIYGIVFLAVGILGFIPGITTGYDQLMFAGHMSGAMLLGIFQVSVLHNIVHLLYGVVGLICTRRILAARQYLIWGGIIYAALWIYGLVVSEESMANFVPLNDADDWLHFALAVTMILLGIFTPPKRARTVRE
ncbi:DUF4383 domain-containing protein [Paramicrobacterium agarici]|uniref:Uncharacterized protein DUF4383 n=1 Tax=Paramicrobacterium agarici TaxID=630514 RepID=A0A2A9DVN0_9MICO|nr:DUF4383 domain-containing protein [Microbacterium agarici]PFG30644.1 uncharacterized protein DUF4383 [Microbacterium agarici]